MEQRRYKAIFFDLDGTLLPMDMEDFLHRYFIKLRAYIAGNGLDAERFSNALNEGMKAMGSEHAGQTNKQVFWQRFMALFGDYDQSVLEGLLMRFYREDFGGIGSTVKANPAAARAVEALYAKGYPLFLTTMPMFPEPALDWRLQWAHVDPKRFVRKTTYDNSFALKPSLSYYRQNIDLAGCKSSEVLMVGNNTREDLSIMQLGADAFLVTDYLLNPIDRPLDNLRHGSLEDFAVWADRLPECEA
ncbi:MAG: HAD family hydrolase [Eggerthellaceae bacterium]|jgi:FMN phosphatase YigB (HAD superfamily)